MRARVIEAKADANYKQGNADARVLAEKLEAEASGTGKMGQAKADATKAMGEAEADAIGRKMSAEAEGLTGKFEAMGKMSADARAHEEFRMQLEAALKQALASLDAGKEVSRENAEVLATALQNANIELTRALTTLENARMEWNSARLKWTVLDKALPASDDPAANGGAWMSAVFGLCHSLEAAS